MVIGWGAFGIQIGDFYCKLPGILLSKARFYLKLACPTLSKYYLEIFRDLFCLDASNEWRQTVI